MFVILANDVNVKRVSKARKIVEKYLQPVQRSVFEGRLADRALRKLKNELASVLDFEEDSVVMYKQEFSGELTLLELGKRTCVSGSIL